MKFDGSDVLKEMVHDGVILTVTFVTDKVYEYQKVPQKLYQLFESIESANQQLKPETRTSVGRLFHYLIRIHPNLYPFKEV